MFLIVSKKSSKFFRFISYVMCVCFFIQYFTVSGLCDEYNFRNKNSIKEPTEIHYLDDDAYYVIHSCEELTFVALTAGEWLNKNYILGSDICLNDNIPIWNEEGICVNPNELINWTPIGNESQPFTGNFFGNGYSIEGLYSVGDDLQNRGLFGVIKGGNIEGLHIKNSYVSNSNKNVLSMAGILSGRIESKNKRQNKISNCIIENCCVKGYRAGGYSGSIGSYYLYLPIIENCYADVFVYGLRGDNIYTGGFFGTANCQAYNCFVTGTVCGHRTLGGFAGWNETLNTLFSNCLATCAVYGEPENNHLEIGGFIGQNANATLTNCFWLQTEGINEGYTESEIYGYAVSENGEIITAKDLFPKSNAKNILNDWIQENNEDYDEWLDLLDTIFLSNPCANFLINDNKTKITSFSLKTIKDQYLITLSVINVPNDAYALVAFYENSNRLTNVKKINLVEGVNYAVIPLSDADIFKAFVWNTELKPLCSMKELSN